MPFYDLTNFLDCLGYSIHDLQSFHVFFYQVSGYKYPYGLCYIRRYEFHEFFNQYWKYYIISYFIIQISNCPMDESLELPTSLPKIPLGDLAAEDDQGSSDEEDSGLDWTKLV